MWDYSYMSLVFFAKEDAWEELKIMLEMGFEGFNWNALEVSCSHSIRYAAMEIGWYTIVLWQETLKGCVAGILTTQSTYCIFSFGDSCKQYHEV
ncbi:hypothetical protein Tco_0835001 [Tanacetum coccineum]